MRPILYVFLARLVVEVYEKGKWTLCDGYIDFAMYLIESNPRHISSSPQSANPLFRITCEESL